MKQSVMIRLKRFWRVARITLLICKAKRLAKKTGVQQFVVKNQGEPQIMSKKQFVFLRQHGCFPKEYTATHLKKISIFHTHDKKRVQRSAGEVSKQLQKNK